jgi:hypothetical protein
MSTPSQAFAAAMAAEDPTDIGSRLRRITEALWPNGEETQLTQEQGGRDQAALLILAAGLQARACGLPPTTENIKYLAVVMGEAASVAALAMRSNA